MNTKKAQGAFGMSFSTIFSIIIIIFIVAVAFFAIRHFVGLSKCTNIGLFYDDLREEVRDAWSSSSGRYESDFEGKLPKSGLFGTGITHVCFGKLSGAADSSDSDKKNSLLTDYAFDESDPYNVFMYPPNKDCASGLSAITLRCGSAECVNTGTQFFCVPVQDDGTVKVRMSKQSNEHQITLRKP